MSKSGPRRWRPETCTYDGCERPHAAGGYCQMHDARIRRNGRPDLKRRARGVMDAPVVWLSSENEVAAPVKRLLSARQARLVMELALAGGRPVSQERLRVVSGARNIDALVNKVRAKLGRYEVIRTVPGVGYALPPAVVRGMEVAS